MNWRIVLKVGSVLMFLGTSGTVVGQNSNGAGSTPGTKPGISGKSAFETRCALCHGLDGLGGEHAPDIVHSPAVKALSDEALFGVIHDGIPQRGMPGFGDMVKEDTDAVIAYLRRLQGKSVGGSLRGDPAQGRGLFFGKAGCSACHRMRDKGQFIAEDLTGFAGDHQVDEIREAILRPSGEQPKAAMAVARDGRQFSGMIRNEDNSSLQLQDADGRFYLLMKSSLASVQRQPGAPMPGDYGQRLSTTELDDLVSYIVREGGASEQSSPPSEKDEEPHAEN